MLVRPQLDVVEMIAFASAPLNADWSYANVPPLSTIVLPAVPSERFVVAL